ncbi:MAG: M23 family metallopeptidase [Chloroflexales bacterium]|nr:M23 family metallopeptidase [Chloroflexales bacterium]
MPRLQSNLSVPVRRRIFAPCVSLLSIWLIAVGAVIPLFLSNSAHAAPQLILPTPPGESWRIIQGYGCGTHNGWDHFSLDLANANGRTYGAPIRASADGKVFVWVSGSGTLILNHGGFYTMYTHMASAVTTQVGHFIPRGMVIGTVGDRGTPGTPHLHFTAFTANGPYASGRRSVPLSFVDGYTLTETGGCNQHGGLVMVANGELIDSVPSIAFNANIELERWYNNDERIEFTTTAAWEGFSQAWNDDPGGDAPMFAQTQVGYTQLSWAGEGLHTFYVRAWGANGQQTVETLGPIGYDVTPPELPPAIDSVSLKAGIPAQLSWPSASDGGSGVAGYRIYLGSDENSSSEWFTPEPQVETPALEAGRYLLRLQTIDYAGNASEWTTLGSVEVLASE